MAFLVPSIAALLAALTALAGALTAAIKARNAAAGAEKTRALYDAHIKDCHPPGPASNGAAHPRP